MRTLVFVAGASGSGTGTSLAALRAPRPYPGCRVSVEDHEAVTDAKFERRCAAGSFALYWWAQGMRYGVPRDLELNLVAGRIVIAKASRVVIAGTVALPCLGRGDHRDCRAQSA